MWRRADPALLRACGYSGVSRGGAQFPHACFSQTRSVTAVAGGAVSAVPSRFSLEALPVTLQREFDVAENRLTLQHLCRASRTHIEGEDVTIVVKPSWTHLVTWRCAHCRHTWDARPADRLNPQLGDQHDCPHCTTARATAPVTAHDAQPDEVRAPPVLGEDVTEAVMDTSRSRSVLAAYPTLAAQWDTARNATPSNRVGGTVSTVPVTSRMAVWWSCPVCTQSWREPVSGRVSRLHRGQQQYGAAFIPLCPSCESRGTERRVQQPAASDVVSPVRAKHVLADDPALLAEAQLRPHQNPAEIALTANTVLNWTCRYCQHNFQASVANRAVRYERCPQCTGKVRTPYNLLAIQRPDVLREVAKTVSRTALSYVTVHDGKELPFVCRTCFSPYRMSARARCALPPGAVACPKCFFNASQLATQLAQVPATGSTEAGQHGSHRKKPAPRWRARALLRRAGRRERSGETLSITRNELRMRDKELRD